MLQLSSQAWRIIRCAKKQRGRRSVHSPSYGRVSLPSGRQGSALRVESPWCYPILSHKSPVITVFVLFLERNQVGGSRTKPWCKTFTNLGCIDLCSTVEKTSLIRQSKTVVAEGELRTSLMDVGKVFSLRPSSLKAGKRRQSLHASCIIHHGEEEGREKRGW